MSAIEICELRSSVQMARAAIGAALVMAQRLGVMEVQADVTLAQKQLVEADKRIDRISQAEIAQRKLPL